MIRKKHVLWVLAFGLVVPFAAFAQQTPQSTTPSATPPAAHEKHMAKAHAVHVNINTAAKEDLMTLPGVTEDTAEKIIAARPFKAKSELVSKNIVTKVQYKKLSSMVMTGHMAKAAKVSTKK